MQKYKDLPQFSAQPGSSSWVVLRSRLLPENLAPGSPRSHDFHRGRPLASPVLFLFIASPAESSTLVGVISRHKTHHKSAASVLLQGPAAELPDHGSAESGAADPHPRTTAVVGGARSRGDNESPALPSPKTAAVSDS